MAAMNIEIGALVTCRPCRMGGEVNLKFCQIEKLFTAKGKGRWVIIELEVNVGDLPPVIWVLHLIHYSSITVSWSI